MKLKSINVWVIHRIKTLKHCLVSFLLILGCLSDIWANLGYLPYGVIIRDKVGDFGEFNCKTLFGNESNFHTKIAFTHIVTRWTHNVRPAVSLSAIQLSTISVFTVLAGWKVEIWRSKRAPWTRGSRKLISCCRQPLSRDWERVEIMTSRLEGTRFLILQTLPHTSAGQVNFCRG